MLEIPFDPYRIYATTDRDYICWFVSLVDRVWKMRKEQESMIKSSYGH